MSAIERTRRWVAAGASALIVSACGSTGVYVGVAVPGPWVGYPGVGYPGYIGRPPVVYEEDALNETGVPEWYAALSDTPGAGTSVGGTEEVCASPGREGASCTATESGTADVEGASGGVEPTAK